MHPRLTFVVGLTLLAGARTAHALQASQSGSPSTTTAWQVVPALPPDSTPASVTAEIKDRRNLLLDPRGIEAFNRCVLRIAFVPTASQGEREAAINDIHGVVVGGYRIPDSKGDGFYEVRIEDDGTVLPLKQALERLSGLPQVTGAGAIYLTVDTAGIPAATDIPARNFYNAPILPFRRPKGVSASDILARSATIPAGTIQGLTIGGDYRRGARAELPRHATSGRAEYRVGIDPVEMGTRFTIALTIAVGPSDTAVIFLWGRDSTPPPLATAHLVGLHRPGEPQQADEMTGIIGRRDSAGMSAYVLGGLDDSLYLVADSGGGYRGYLSVLGIAPQSYDSAGNWRFRKVGFEGTFRAVAQQPRH